jgi:hypothetical protein
MAPETRREESKMDRNTYQQLINEGGQGYNPHDRIDTTPTPRTADSILRDLRAADSAAARDCMPPAQAQARVDRLRAEYDAARDAEHAEHVARLIEIGFVDAAATRSRREGWAARVRAGEFGSAVDWTAVRAAESSQGWTIDDLRAAVVHYGM